MTNQEKRQQLGELLVCIRETGRDLAAHHLQANNAAKALRCIAGQLEESPSLITSETYPNVEWEWLDRERILGLCAKSRELRERLKSFEDQESKLG